MRKARIRDYKEKASHIEHYPVSIRELSQQINGSWQNFKPTGIMGIVGANGSGKTSFLKYLSGIPCDELSFLPQKYLFYANKSETFIEMQDNNNKAIFNDLIYTNAYEQLSKGNQNLKNFKTTVGQNESSSFKPEIFSLIKYVLNKNYTSIKFEEIEVKEDTVFPYFSVKTNNTMLDNYSLSLGELLILYICWYLLYDLKHLKILLLDEPESGLSPATQKKLIDLICYISSERKIQVIMSTHSATIVEAIGNEQCLVIQNDATIRWDYNNNFTYLVQLGIEPVKKGIILLEDAKAKLFLEKLLDLYGSTLRKQYDFIHLGGESHITEILKRFPNKHSFLQIIGVFDADQREKTDFTQFDGNVFILPGTLAPEEEVINAVTKKVTEYSELLYIPQKTLRANIEKCTNMDHHDFFEELSKISFGEIKQTLFETGFNVWLRDYQDREQIHNFIRSFDPSISEDDIKEVDMTYPLYNA